MSHPRMLRLASLVAAACVVAAAGVVGVTGVAALVGATTAAAPDGETSAPPRPAPVPPGSGAVAAQTEGAVPAAPRPGATGPAVAAQPNRFYDAPLFFGGLRAVRAGASGAPGSLAPAPGVPARRLVGGLTSHHALAASVISTLFVAFDQAPPRTVIVVGPNHENQGPKVITGQRPWESDFGLVEADQAIISLLTERNLAELNDEILSTEHSVGTLVPYIKYHAPQARVVPLIISRDLPQTEVRRLAREIAPLLGSGTLLVASVDFSHYLTGPEAEVKDEETLAAIRAFDLDRLWQMGPDHLDSPQSLALLMLTMQELGAQGPEVAAHTHSGRLVGVGQVETTSYFTFIYRSAD